MRTEVAITAEAGRSPRVDATGGLAVRRTGPDAAHLVGTAATPLGGDHIEVSIRVAPGARLTLGSVAATIALAGADRPDSTARWTIDVDDGGCLRVDLLPMVIAGGAVHRTDIVVGLHPDATLDLREHVQIGRDARHYPDDATGSWTGGMHIDSGGRPLLRHRLALGGAGVDSVTATHRTNRRTKHRAVSSVFRYPDTRLDAVDPVDFVARLRLAGDASLTTALGSSVARTAALCDALDASAT